MTCSSARRRWPATSATSSPSWDCRLGRRPPRTRTSTTSSEVRVLSAHTQNYPCASTRPLHDPPDAANASPAVPFSKRSTQQGGRTMSDQNIAAVRRLTQEGFVAGKVDVVDDVVAEDCLDHDPLPGQGQGRQGQRHTCQMVVGGLSNRSTLQDDFLAVGDTVVENWIFQGTHTGDFLGVPATGKRLQVRGIEIWRLANGKIVERWGVVDAAGVMEQLAS